jgi:hypothetical protein
MAEPRDSYPESATHGSRGDDDRGDGEAALRAALAEHGDELAAAVERTDELEELLRTAILVAASADETELEYVTDSTANAVAAADGLTTGEAAKLAAQVGGNANDLATVLETVLELERGGHLEELVALARQLSALEVEPATVEGANTVLAAIGDAERESEPVGLVGLLRGLRTADARAGLGYLLAILRSLGRRRRNRE